MALRLIIYGFMSTIVTFCGNPTRVLPPPEPFEAVFHENARKHGWDSYPTTLEVKYEFIEDFTNVAKCDFSDNTVRIDAQTWEQATETYREKLIFHELGHCLLMRNHRNECSIMHENFVSDEFYTENRFDLIAELFSMRGSKVINEENYKCG